MAHCRHRTHADAVASRAFAGLGTPPPASRGASRGRMQVSGSNLQLTFTDASGTEYTQSNHEQSYCDGCDQAEHKTILAGLCAAEAETEGGRTHWRLT